MSELDPRLYRPLFPATSRRVYLNSAAVAPCSTRVRDAVCGWMSRLSDEGLPSDMAWDDEVAVTRARAAALVGASPSEVAFVRSTSHGLGIVAEGLGLAPGDEVVVCIDQEYPSNVYAWRHLERRGVRVVELAAVGGGVEVSALERVMTGRTRVVAASSVQFSSGHRTPLAEVGSLCATRGALLVVDAIQSLGAFPIDVAADNISALSSCSHKWMLGMTGIGILVVREALLERIDPPLVGWRATRDLWAFDSRRFELASTAARFEEGSLAYPLIAGLGAALELAAEIGVERIASHITGLVDRAESGLVELGCDVGPRRERRAGILLFSPPSGSTPPDVLHQALVESGFAVSLRRGRIRVAPHIFNTTDEIDQLLDAVRERLTKAG